MRIAAVSLDTPENMIETHDYVGAAEAARHIAALGHTRIAHIHGPDSFLSAAERLRGFRVGLAEYGDRLAMEPPAATSVMPSLQVRDSAAPPA